MSIHTEQNHAASADNDKLCFYDVDVDDDDFVVVNDDIK